MDKAQIEDSVYKLLSKYVKQEFRITDDVFTNGWVNSIESLELRLDFEREFGISVGDAEAKDLRTVETMTRFIQQRIR